MKEFLYVIKFHLTLTKKKLPTVRVYPDILEYTSKQTFKVDPEKLAAKYKIFRVTQKFGVTHRAEVIALWSNPIPRNFSRLS